MPNDETELLAGWAADRIVQDRGAWKIRAKPVNLIDCGQSIRKPGIIL